MFSSDAGTATQVTIASSGNGTVNGTYDIDDILDDKRFIVDLGKQLQMVKLALLAHSMISRNHLELLVVNHLQIAMQMLQITFYANAGLIAEEAVGRMIAEQTQHLPFQHGNQNCIDDVKDFIQSSITHNLRWGGNDRVYDAANYYIRGAHVPGEQDRSVEVFNYSRDMAMQEAHAK